MWLVVKLMGEDKDKLTQEPLAKKAFLDVKTFLLLGTLMAGNTCGFVLATKYLSALTCSIMQPTVPVLAAILGTILGIEEISFMKFVSIVCSVMGAVIVVLMGEHAAQGAVLDRWSLTIGSTFLFMNVSCNAAYWVMQKNALKTYPPILATASACMYTAAISVGAAIASYGFDVNAWTLNGFAERDPWYCLIYAVFIATCLTYCTQGWANKQTTPTAVTAFMTLPPLFCALISWGFLNVTLTGGQLFGGVTIVAGLVLNIKAQAQQEAQAEAKKLLAGENA